MHIPGPGSGATGHVSLEPRGQGPDKGDLVAGAMAGILDFIQWPWGKILTIGEKLGCVDT